jgi:hypothetical protein
MRTGTENVYVVREAVIVDDFKTSSQELSGGAEKIYNILHYGEPVFEIPENDAALIVPLRR